MLVVEGKMGANHRNGNGSSGGQIAEWRRDPAKFITQVLINPETKQPFQLYDAQHQFLEEGFRLTPDGRLVHTELVFSGPKKLGKSTFISWRQPSQRPRSPLAQGQPFGLS